MGAAGTGGEARDSGVESGDGAAPNNVVGASGGTASDPSGFITLTIPAGWLRGATAFTFTPLSSLPSLPSDLMLVAGTAWEIDWTGAGFVSTRFAHIRIRPRALASPPADQDSSFLQADDPLADDDYINCNNVDHLCLSDDPEADCTNLPQACEVQSDSPGSVRVASVNVPPQKTIPKISTQPADVTVPAGAAASFSVTTANALTYQWLRNGDLITGATSTMFRIDAASVSDNGAKFRAAVSDAKTTVYSANATMTVTGPAAPAWGPSTVGGAFATGIDAPVAGGDALLGSFVVWNDNGRMRSDHDGMGTWLDSLPTSVRGRPQVLSTLLDFVGFIVYIDDDGENGCTGATGDMLRAVAYGQDLPELNQLPLSSPFTLYKSTGDCIDKFSADAISLKSQILDLRSVGTTRLPVLPIAYALTEVNAQKIKVGVGGATQGWVLVPGQPLVLPLDAACSGPVRNDYPPVLAGDQQTILPPYMQESDRDPTTPSATLAWVATMVVNGVHSQILCGTTLGGSGWNTAMQLFPGVAGPPTVAMTATGEGLVAASAYESQNDYRVTAASYTASQGWRVQTIEGLDGAVAPYATFSANGTAFVIWNWTFSALVAVTHRTPDGTWDPLPSALADATATGTALPARIYADGAGNAVALFGQSFPGTPTQIWSSRFAGGQWSNSSLVQTDAYEATGVDCQRYQTGDSYSANYSTLSPVAAWREKDPNDATKFRIVIRQ
jgi:hypothetical protein